MIWLQASLTSPSPPLSFAHSALATLPSLLFFNTVGPIFSQFHQPGILCILLLCSGMFSPSTAEWCFPLYFRCYANAILSVRISPIIMKLFSIIVITFQPPSKYIPPPQNSNSRLIYTPALILHWGSGHFSSTSQAELPNLIHTFSWWQPYTYIFSIAQVKSLEVNLTSFFY